MTAPDDRPREHPGAWTVLGRTRHIHLVGVGGTGMSGIAEVLLNLGYQVSGSDLGQNEVTRRLIALGGKVHRGHRAEQVTSADVVVYSSAVGADNPEIAAARARGIPVIPRAEMLAELMRLKVGIAVAGAHGKTTTTWLTGLVLDHAELDPTIVVGGRLKALRTGARLGWGDFMVVEADESDGSFLSFSPAIAVVTNIAREHLDFYPSLASIQEAFVRFLGRIPFYGAAVCCAEDANIRAILPRVERKIVTYGLGEDARIRATDLELVGPTSSFRVWADGHPLGRVKVRLAGRHNVLNALAAVAVGLELGLPFDRIHEGLGAFTGIARRMETRGEAGGVLWVDDYAHHPDEVAATLAGARQIWQRRLVAVFQPHRYSRVQELGAEFGPAFAGVDHVLVAALYGAGEEPIEGVDAGIVARAVGRQGGVTVEYLPERDALVARLAEILRPGDVLLTLGAGDVWRVGESVIRARAAANTHAEDVP